MNERTDKDALTTWSAIVPNFFHDAMAYLFPPLAVFLTVLLIDSQFSPSLLSFTPYSSAISEWMNEGDGANAVMVAILLFISPIVVFPFLYVVGQLISQLSPIVAMANPLRWIADWSETFESWLQRALIGRNASYKRNYSGYAARDRRTALSISDTNDSDDAGLRKQIAYQEMAANCATLYALALLIAVMAYSQPLPTWVAEEYDIAEWNSWELAIYGSFYLIAWMRFQALEFLIRERVEGIAFTEEKPRRRRSRRALIAVFSTVFCSRPWWLSQAPALHFSHLVSMNL